MIKKIDNLQISKSNNKLNFYISYNIKKETPLIFYVDIDDIEKISANISETESYLNIKCKSNNTINLIDFKIQYGNQNNINNFCNEIKVNEFNNSLWCNIFDKDIILKYKESTIDSMLYCNSDKALKEGININYLENKLPLILPSKIFKDLNIYDIINKKFNEVTNAIFDLMSE